MQHALDVHRSIEISIGGGRDLTFANYSPFGRKMAA
tara:strand:- start:19838 stop:19945 length:108 start_codon:yes stop_codon:yes gene_type:complete